MLCIVLGAFGNFYYIMQTAECNPEININCYKETFKPIILSRTGEGFFDSILNVF
jgi:hypothetical protein